MEDVLVVSADGVEIGRGTASELVVDRSIRGPFEPPAGEAALFELSRQRADGLEVVGSGESRSVISEPAEAACAESRRSQRSRSRPSYPPGTSANSGVPRQ